MKPRSPFFSVRRPLFVATSLALLFATAPSFAQAPVVVDDATRSAARTLTEQGLSLFDSRQFEAALDMLSRADDLVRLPTTGLNLARTYAQVGKLVEASEKYLAVTKLELDESVAPAQRKAQGTAAAERAALLPRLASLEIAVEPAAPNAVVTLDDHPVPKALIGIRRPANPGSHTVVLTLNGQAITQSVMLTEGHSQRLVLRPVLPPPKPELAPPPSPAEAPPAVVVAVPPSVLAPLDRTESPDRGGAAEQPSSSGARIAGVVFTALGGAGLASAGVLGLVTMSTVGDLTSCTDDLACSRGDQEAFLAKAVDQQNAAIVALSVGGGLALTGVVLLAVSSDSGDSQGARAAFAISPTAASFRLTW